MAVVSDSFSRRCFRVSSRGKRLPHMSRPRVIGRDERGEARVAVVPVVRGWWRARQPQAKGRPGSSTSGGDIWRCLANESQFNRLLVASCSAFP